MYRISVPFISECPFVTKCLVGLKQVLIKDVAIQLMAKWFVMRNAPGSKNLNPRQEWSIFKIVLLGDVKNLLNIFMSFNINLLQN